jgi:hypothetical protein
VLKQAVGQRRLAVVDVRDDAKVTDVVEGHGKGRGKEEVSRTEDEGSDWAEG